MKLKKERVRAGLNTRSVTLTLIGGEGEFCAERFGFRQDKNGLVAGYAPIKVEPAASVASAVAAKGLSAFGYNLLISKLGQLFKWNTSEFTAVKSIGVLSNVAPFIIPCTYGGENVYAVFSGKKLGILRESGLTQSTLPYKLHCGTMQCGRVFARDFDDPYLVRWSGTDIKDWACGIDGGGYVRVPPEGGEITGMAVFGEKTALVRKYGITVLRAFGDARHFRMEKTDHSALPEVFGGTAVVCAGRLWLYTAEGIYVYDGSSLTLANGGSDETGGKDYTCVGAAAFGNRYIFYSCVKGSTKFILEYDTRDNVLTPCADGCGTVFDDGKIPYCFSGNALTRLLSGGDDPNRVWISKPVDLGTPYPKTLKSISADGEGDIRITVSCGGRERSAGLGYTAIAERGTSFTFTVKGSGKLESLRAEWEVNV